MADGIFRDILDFFDDKSNTTQSGDDGPIAFDRSTWIIGRGSDCDIVYSKPKVSRHHCRIDYIDSHFYLTDLNSTNGTFLNGRRIERKERIFVGDIIGLGSDDIVFTRELLM